MRKLLPFLCAVTALLMMAVPATALDNSLESSYGKKRVKIERRDKPQDVAETRIQNARARHAARLRECEDKGDRNKQYCLQEAENQLMIDERHERDALRRAVKE